MKKTSIALLILLQASIVFSQGAFRYRREITPVQTEGWHSVILPAELYQHLTSSYADLRLFQLNGTDTTEVPYLLRIKNDEVSEGYLSLPVLNKSTKDGKLYLTFRLAQGQEVNYLDLDFEEDNYNGLVKLEGSNDQQEWFQLVDQQRILSIKNAGVDFNFSTLHFPPTTYSYLRATISSDKALTFKNVSFRNKKITEGSFYELTPCLHTIQNKKEKQTITEINIHPYQPISKLSVKINTSGDYYRSFTLEALRDSAQAPNQSWNYYYEPVTSGYLTSVSSDNLEFAIVSSKKLKLTVYNQDNAPLQITSITASGPKTELVAKLAAGNTFLYYGNPLAPAPAYDLVHFTDQVPAQLTPVTLREEQQLIEDVAKETPLLVSKVWLWIAMALIIGLLGFATLRMMSKK